jgi:hypothetical protein
MNVYSYNLTTYFSNNFTFNTDYLKIGPKAHVLENGQEKVILKVRNKDSALNSSEGTNGFVGGTGENDPMYGMDAEEDEERYGDEYDDNQQISLNTKTPINRTNSNRKSGESLAGRFFVEYSKSGRATCVRCRCMIDESTVRIGSSIKLRGKSIDTVKFTHLACFKLPKGFTSTEFLASLEGLHELGAIGIAKVYQNFSVNNSVTKEKKISATDLTTSIHSPIIEKTKVKAISKKIDSPFDLDSSDDEFDDIKYPDQGWVKSGSKNNSKKQSMVSTDRSMKSKQNTKLRPFQPPYRDPSLLTAGNSYSETIEIDDTFDSKDLDEDIQLARNIKNKKSHIQPKKLYNISGEDIDVESVTEDNATDLFNQKTAKKSKNVVMSATIGKKRKTARVDDSVLSPIHDDFDDSDYEYTRISTVHDTPMLSTKGDTSILIESAQPTHRMLLSQRQRSELVHWLDCFRKRWARYRLIEIY